MSDIKKVRDLVSCDADDCGNIRLLSQTVVCLEVLLVPAPKTSKGYQGRTSQLHFCQGCAPPWTSHTNTSGRDRYYLRHNVPLGKVPLGSIVEVDMEGEKL